MSRKCYVIADFLSENNKKEMSKAAEAAGFDIEFFDNPAEAEGKVSDAEVVYSGLYDNTLKQMPGLRWCHTAFAGIGAYSASGLFDSGDIILTNSSGAYGRAIGEHIIMVSLLLLRKMPKYNKLMAAHGWARTYPIRSIADSTVAIIGTGDIGSNAALKFKGLGAKKVIGFNRSGASSEAFDEVYGLAEFDDLFKDKSFSESIDVLVLCVPGTAESAGMLSRERIAMLSDRTYIVNVGRGAAIDQDALIEALNYERIAGAALDVMYPEPLPPEHPLWTAKNTIVTPHISGDMGLQYTVDKTVEIFCENLKRYSRGEKLIKQVDIKKGY